MRPARPRALVGAAVLAVVAFARADEPDRAEELFQRARPMLDEKRFAEACPLLEQSLAIEPRGGTLLALALCHEGLGRTATAWAEYRRALDVARKDGRASRERVALERIAALEPRLPRLRVVVSRPTADLAIERDGAPLDRSLWGSAEPVDAGRHSVGAHSPGKVAWKLTVEATEGRTIDVAVPDLTDEAPIASVSAPPPPPASTSQPEEPPKRPPALGYAAIGVGVAALAIGGIFGVRAIEKRKDSDADCPGGACNRTGWDTYSQAKTAARVADVAVPLGLVAAGFGAYWLLMPAANGTGVGSSGVVVSGVW